MDFEKFDIEGLILIKLKVLGDERGYFQETFNQKKYKELFDVIDFIQDNESKSSYGVVRGLHFQKPPFAQAKLVRCIQGEVLDIAVDLRKASPIFGKSQAVLLNDTNKHQFFIPRGFAHGFVVLSEEAIFSYKVDNDYAPQYDAGVRFDDPDLNLDWKLPSEVLKLSAKDKGLPLLKDMEILF